MKYRRPSRLRRVAKWAGVALCLIVVFGWVITLKWEIVYSNNAERWQVRLSAGGVALLDLGKSTHDMTAPYTHPTEWRVRKGALILDNRAWLRSPSWLEYPWLPRYVNAIGRKWIHIPLVWPLAILASATAVVWYRDRRPKPGHCHACGYDLTGNTSGVCPECGEATC